MEEAISVSQSLLARCSHSEKGFSAGISCKTRWRWQPPSLRCRFTSRLAPSAVAASVLSSLCQMPLPQRSERTGPRPARGGGTATRGPD
ncbi:unnamed protein product [Bubo scandiacus]